MGLLIVIGGIFGTIIGMIIFEYFKRYSERYHFLSLHLYAGNNWNSNVRKRIQGT